MNSNCKFRARVVSIVSIKCRSEHSGKIKRSYMRLSIIWKPKFKEGTHKSKNSVKKMLSYKAKRTEETRSTSHFMTHKDSSKISWERKKTNAWMQNFKSRGFRCNMKSTKRTKQPKSTESCENLTLKTRLLTEKQKQSEDFNKKFEWKTTRFNHLSIKSKISEPRSSDRCHPSINHPRTRTKIFWKNLLSKWKETNPSQRTTMKFSWKLLSISWEQKRTMDWKAKFRSSEINLIWWGETRPFQMFNQLVQHLKMSSRAKSVNLRE